MKVYLRIIGIICTLITVITFVSVIGVAISDNEYEYLGFIPLVYLFSHYLVLTRFGFKRESNKYDGILFIVSILTMIAYLSIPSFLYFNYQQDKKSVSNMIDWGIDTTAYGITTKLKTKLIDGDLQYAFEAKFADKTTPLISQYNVDFHDNDGFSIEKIAINELTSSLDESNTIMGNRSNNLVYWGEDYFDKYKRIAGYEVTVQAK